ncbi:MAG TPA: hypothetical protein VMV27_01890 [Candidatus Binataceae bacterium]|nr:hypothetical protein [Candidatus Binataceae bacterium]
MPQYRVQYNQAGDAYYVKELVAKGVWLSVYEYRSPAAVPTVMAPFTGIVEIKRSGKEIAYRKFFAVSWWNFLAGKEVTRSEKNWLVRDYIAATRYAAPVAAQGPKGKTGPLDPNDLKAAASSGTTQSPAPAAEAPASTASGAKPAKAEVQTTAKSGTQE